jgi:hypothetical protein
LAKTQPKPLGSVNWSKKPWRAAKLSHQTSDTGSKEKRHETVSKTLQMAQQLGVTCNPGWTWDRRRLMPEEDYAGVPELTFADYDLNDLVYSEPPVWIKQIPGTDYREDQREYDNYLLGFEEGNGFKVGGTGDMT